jgi:hypothetical protein
LELYHFCSSFFSITASIKSIQLCYTAFVIVIDSIVQDNGLFLWLDYKLWRTPKIQDITSRALIDGAGDITSREIGLTIDNEI